MISVIPNYHPIMVHFTIGLIVTAWITLFLNHLLSKKPQWQKESLIVSRWCLWLAAFSSILTVVAGFHAYYTVSHDTPSHQVMTVHRNLGIATFVLIWLTASFSFVLYLNKKRPKFIFSLVLTITTAFVLITGWYGAELVFRYGLGVMSLPKTEVAGHQHTQANAHSVIPKTKSVDKHNHSH
jgi:uncharacterized membrane protein